MLKEALIPIPTESKRPGKAIVLKQQLMRKEPKEFKVIKGKYIWIEIDFQRLHTAIMPSVIQLVKLKS
jgi:hypothetical protein